MPLNRETSTDEYLGTFSKSTEKGEKIERVLSLVDKLYMPNKEGKRAINVDQWTAAGVLREMLMKELHPSEGVSSYGQSVRASQATTKADRRGKLYTGYEVQITGEIIYAGGRRSRANERNTEDAIIAACGIRNANGRVIHVDIKQAEILIRAILHTEDMPTLAGLTQELTAYYGAKSKQAPPYALGVLQTALGRLSSYFIETGVM